MFNLSEDQFEERRSTVIKRTSQADSSLLLEAWWQTIQEEEPHRLTKDLLKAFIGHENTPKRSAMKHRSNLTLTTPTDASPKLRS